MSKRVPVTRQTSWLMAIPQFILLFVLVFAAWLLLEPQLGIMSIAVGAGIYLIYSYGSRMLLTREHRQGMKFTRQDRFRDAIEEYEQSYAFFSKYLWIDRFRSVVLLTPSAASYREMALINIAYCYAQLGEGQKAKAYYERTLAEFPGSSMAEAALNLIRSIEKGGSE